MNNEFTRILGNTPKKILCVHFDNPRDMIIRGLEYFLGERAEWLVEYEKVVSWMVDNQNKGLVVNGSNGRGKTLICYDILPVLFNVYHPSAKQYKCRANEMRYILQPENNDYYTFLQANIIFIDDFGTESIANSFGEKRDVFSDIVDICEHDKKMLIASTNLMPQEIEERYGLRTLDRLHSITRGITFDGVSLRGKREE